MDTPPELVRVYQATPQALADVAAVMRECEDYYRSVQGHPADEQEAAGFFRFAVPGIAAEDVHAYVVYSGGRAVGLASLVLGFRENGERKSLDEFVAEVVILEKDLGG